MLPLPDSGLSQFGEWIAEQTWEKMYKATTAHEKANIFQTLLMSALDEYLPEKITTFSSDDQAWMTPELKQLDRRRKREFRKHRKSPKWTHLDLKLEEKANLAKQSFYKNMIEDLKISNPGQWYSKLKRMSSHDQMKGEVVNVEELSGRSDKDQAEIIADRFESVANRYNPLADTDVILPSIPEGSVHQIEVDTVYKALLRIKTTTSTVANDIPAKVIKLFASDLAAPLRDIIQTSILRGEFANLWKLETVTPVPKVFPPLLCKQLRKISVFMNFSKVTEQILSEYLVEDMRAKLTDRSSATRKVQVCNTIC